ncbi:50S ribosomal protein L3 [Patescibacteria group bacterium]|nr:50S ribosomal protein L3 [Patescibacteria group bacterium]
MKFILGKKIEMTQRFNDEGRAIPVTAVEAGPCVVTQLKTMEKDGYTAVQIGFQASKRINKPQLGHLKGLSNLRRLREFRINDDPKLKRGDAITAAVFQPGDKVSVIGTSKGKGFQGVVKRHGFAGGKGSHGDKDQLRMPGSIGATDPGRVFKGTRMAGQMGNKQSTVQDLEIIEVDSDNNILYIKGAVPGARHGLLEIFGAGDMTIVQPDDQEKNTDQKPEVAPEKEVKEIPAKDNNDKADAKDEVKKDIAKSPEQEKAK